MDGSNIIFEQWSINNKNKDFIKKEKPIQYSRKKLKTYKFNLIRYFLISLIFRVIIQIKNIKKKKKSKYKKWKLFVILIRFITLPFNVYFTATFSSFRGHTVFPPFRKNVKFAGNFSRSRRRTFRKFIGRRIGLPVYHAGDRITGTRIGRKVEGWRWKGIDIRGRKREERIWGSEFKGAVLGKGIIIAGKMLELQR